MKLSRQFPPQTGPYQLQVKNGAGWHDFDTARLHISVGQPYHEGEKFKAQCEWIKHRFSRAIVCVNDVLQRHNMMLDGMNEPLATFRCINQGGEWIARNRHALAALPSPEVHQWMHWTTSRDFADEHRRVRSLYAQDRDFRKVVDDEVLAFWKRRTKDGDLSESYRFSAFKIHSTNYLLEETAAFFVMFNRDRAADIYPGSILLPCTLAKQYGAGDSSHFTRIDFARRKSGDLTPVAAPAARVA